MINKNNYKQKIKQLIIKILSAVVVLFIIWLGIKFFTSIFPSINKVELTEAEKRKEKYNEKTFGQQEIKEKDVDRFVALIDNYYNYCNNKEYEKAYALIHDDCKNKMFSTLDLFKIDVDKKFNKLKRYRYKNLSNVGDDYVYNLILFDDVLAYGTNQVPEQLMYYIVIKDSKDGAKLSLDGYVYTDNTRITSKFDGGMISIIKRDIYYDYIDVTLEITNNTDNVIVIPKDNIKYLIKSKSNELDYPVYSLIKQYEYLYAISNSTNTEKITFRKSFDTIKYKDYTLNFDEVYYISAVYTNKALVALLLEDDYKNGYINKFNITMGL